MRLAVKSGVIIPVLLMLPNVAWMLLPKLAVVSTGSVPLVLTIAENVTKVAVLALPFFYTLDLNKKYAPLALAGMVLALAVYYAAWGRYFIGGGTPELLSASLFGIPSPLAFAPIAFLMISSYTLNSWWMFGAAVVFGTLHVWVKALTS